MWNLLAFAGVGLLVAAAARLMYTGRPMTHVLGTLAFGAAGGLAGGAISWIYWPKADSLQLGSLFVAVVGAVVAIQIWTGILYMRIVRGRATH